MAVRSLLSLSGGGMAETVKKSSGNLKTGGQVDFCGKEVEAMKHGTEWCVAAGKNRYMRCGMSSNKIEICQVNAKARDCWGR